MAWVKKADNKKYNETLDLALSLLEEDLQSYFEEEEPSAKSFEELSKEEQKAWNDIREAIQRLKI